VGQQQHPAPKPEPKLELADIFRLHGPTYLQKYGERMPPSHIRAIADIIDCRTSALGGQIYFCDDCADYRYSYHSCKNRNCNKCGHEQTQEWLEAQKRQLLPVTYFLATFTLHDNLRRLAGSHQWLFYDLLFRTSAAAMQKLARDPEFVGGDIGMAGVLQTWTRDLSVLHPHTHYIVPGGGLSDDGNTWLPARENFLMPKRALSKIFRAKFRDALKQAAPELFNTIPPQTWKEKWVVHLEPVGTGEHALEYLAPYIFQVAISNKRLLKLENGMVTFKYKHGKTKQWKVKTMPVEKFIASFLQHVLPPRFVKVRYYGLLSSQQRERLEKAKELLAAQNTKPETQAAAEPLETASEPDEPAEEKPKTLCCPKCGKPMRWVKEVPRDRTATRRMLLYARSP
jgi:hypothetical protein